VGPGALAHVLRQLPRPTNSQLLVGIDTADDAGVYQLDATTALVQTVDFFTPIVDDPYLFGQIAAANSLSDVYAMGGKPLTAMNIVAFPICSMDAEVLLAILQGGQSKVTEAGAVIVGGHTIEDAEPKYGLSVTGVVHPEKIWTNAGAEPGDKLILTKALGTGVLATAARAGMFPEGVAAAEESMVALNKTAAEIAGRFTVHACTDVTGFGLLGHLSEMAVASGVRMEIDSQKLPLLPEALEAATMGLIPAGAYANRDYLTAVTIRPGVATSLGDLCFDPQTSGGLIICLPEIETGPALEALKAAGVSSSVVIGSVVAKGGGEIYVY